MAATLTGANALSKSFHAGKACENGLLAALLAQNGFTANESAIEKREGFRRHRKWSVRLRSRAGRTAVGLAHLG